MTLFATPPISAKCNMYGCRGYVLLALASTFETNAELWRCNYELSVRVSDSLRAQLARKDTVLKSCATQLALIHENTSSSVQRQAISDVIVSITRAVLP